MSKVNGIPNQSEGTANAQNIEPEKQAHGIDRRTFLKLMGLTAGGAAMPGALMAAGPALAQDMGGGTLNFGHLGDFQYFDPYLLPLADWPMFNQIYNVLARYDDTLTPQPELAESWELSDDGLTLTFKLRPGVKFHNGRGVVADDVKFSLEYAQDPETGANIRTLARAVASVEVVDELTVAFHFAEPTPAAFDLIDLLFIVNSESIEEINSNPVGTGPFRFAEWAPGDFARFERFEGYFREGVPQLDEVIVRAIPDSATMIANLEGGTLDLIAAPPASEFERLEAADGIKVVRGFPGGLVWDLSLNTGRAPFDNKLVRQALQHALDRQRIVDIVFFNVSDPWLQPQSDKSPLYDPDLEGYYTFDLDKARSLLEEAGYADGFEFTVLTATTNPDGARLLQVFQADLAQLGITLHIDEVEPAQYRPRALDLDFDGAIFTYGRASKDPASLFGTTGVWRPGPDPINLSNFSTEEYRRLIAEGQREIDPVRRQEIYQELNRYQLEESFILVIAPVVRWWAMKDSVEGFASNLDSMPILERVSIEG
ncbi:MAG: ABC transporter substrate-binding protein [Chloroflexota bacterium]|nr:ABC transporter substrate-binding protein [Chloroflexota bacterium]MDE2947616.1 ABC transporter substrate-binding protein [Chloroflexota bacterium]